MSILGHFALVFLITVALVTDNGYHSQAFFHTQTALKIFWQKWKQQSQFLRLDVIEANLKDYFLFEVIFSGENGLDNKLAQQ